MSKASDNFEEGKNFDDYDDENYHADSKTNDRNKFDAKESFKATLTDDEILEKLQQYFYEDETLANHFETFIDKNSHIVDLNSDEYKLEYTKVFDEYKALFELKMEDFIEKQLGVSIQDVYKALKRKVDGDENSMEAFFAQILIAVTDFDVFMNMMRDSARKFSRK